jgi:hypothetical protein
MKKIKIRKVEKNNLKKQIWKTKRKKKGKVKKSGGEESLWITIVIHSEMCVGEQLKKSKNIILKNKEIK